MVFLSFLAVPFGYLLGSVPSAYIIGRLMGHTDMRTEGDGHISAAAVHRRVGRVVYVLVVFMDIGLGALAIIFARMLTDSEIIILIAGFAAVVGHNWSVFLKFKGGLGATTIGGVLAAVMLWQLLIGLGIAAIVVLATRKSGVSTGICIVVVTIILLIQFLLQLHGISPILVPYPVALILLMLLKRFQIRRAGPDLPVPISDDVTG